jgi:hypothetical protein
LVANGATSVAALSAPALTPILQSEETIMRKINSYAAALIAGIASAGMMLVVQGIHAQTTAIPDEAQKAGRDAASFPQATEDYFRDMDNGVLLNADEVQGRNMWLVWTGGNDRFWDKLTGNSLGTFDLLKIVTSHPSQTYCNGKHCDRDSRWEWLGAVNEPCFTKPTQADPKRFGLWLDVRDTNCASDPFENEKAYPGVKIGARGKTFTDGTTLPVGSYYGYPTGILGLRLFPNPAFDQAARDKWDAERYYTDENYYNDPNLIKPYRVGMSCGFCHLGPSPLHPPADPSKPEFSNINSTVGAQYLWMDRVFVWSGDTKKFLYQLMHSYPPGTMDTSLVSTDYINNPRTMNAVYLLGERLQQSLSWGKETLKGGELNNKQLPPYFNSPTSWSPRVLKDGSDSVGVMGALNRVYLNIGLYSEDWMTHFNAFFGGKKITPIEIATAEKGSPYWKATEIGTFNIAKFFLKAGRPDPLEKAPGGKDYLTASAETLDRGKIVFAETCARCHSSKLPDEARAKLDPGGCSGPKYKECWGNYWAYTKTDEFKAKMREIVQKPDFLDGNYLSTDARIPVTLLRTNACSPLATNAIRGNIWDNFSSSTYKDLPSVGTITVQDPADGKRWQFPMPGGGRGFTRVPSLVSVWSTAPFLLNNRLGTFYSDPSVATRMKGFDESIHQLLWPETRPHEDGFDGFIVRTTERSSIEIPKRSVPVQLKNLVGDLPEPFARLFDRNGTFKLGPIPKGFPINIAASYQPMVDVDARGIGAHVRNVASFGLKVVENLPSLDLNADDAKLLAWGTKVREPLLKLSKCPDFVVNRGHYFGTAKFNDTDGLTADEKSFGTETPLSDDDKKALIEFIKTF